VKKIVPCLLYSALAVLLLAAGLSARDINLDAIYINTDSPVYGKLLEKKIEAYQAANSECIDRDVIFAGWGDGTTILYVRELQQLNVVYAYNRSTRKTREIGRINGTITALKQSAGGSHLFIKRLVEVPGSVPRGETMILNVATKKISVLESSYPFLDFSVSPGGNSILYETRAGIVEYSPDSEERRVSFKRSEYADMARPGEPVIAHLSPNGKKTVVVSGSGGSYRSRLTAAGISWTLPGVTSASELYWLDNNQLVYRIGASGNYSVCLYNAVSRRSIVLLENSLNTNIQYSAYPKIVSFLQDQVIRVYDVKTQELVNTCLDGEDTSFSPDGNRFISLYLKKLFITGITSVKKKNTELIKKAKEITAMYQNLLENKNNLSNEYSREYVRKKISAYGTISD
jgi:hypothetical protein